LLNICSGSLGQCLLPCLFSPLQFHSEHHHFHAWCSSWPFKVAFWNDLDKV
jgi:hypothetical protein